MGEGLSVTGTVCHGGKAEDQQGIVAKVRGQGVEGQEGGQKLCFIAQAWERQDGSGGPGLLQIRELHS